jgi:peptide/nickel transport system permease protein
VTTQLPPATIVRDDAFAPALPPRSNWQQFRRRFIHHKLAVASIVVLVVLFVACFGAPWLAPYPKNHQNLLADVTGPNAKHWFGVDDLGRDQLTEIMYAGRIDLLIGLSVALFSSVVGTVVGLLAGYYGRWVDEGLSRATDLFLVIPDLAILAVVLKWLGRSPVWFIVVLSALGWMYVARIVRSQVISLKEKEFVESARVAGASDTRILVRHILPNCTGSILVNATLTIALAIVTEATLSFLGLGIQRPDTSWGSLLNDAESAASNFPKFYLILFPGLMLLLTIMAVNFIGDGLRDAFDVQT